MHGNGAWLSLPHGVIVNIARLYVLITHTIFFCSIASSEGQRDAWFSWISTTLFERVRGASRHTEQEPPGLGVACLVTIPPHVRHHRLFPDLPSKLTLSLDITYNHAFPKRLLQPPIWEVD